MNDVVKELKRQLVLLDEAIRQVETLLRLRGGTLDSQKPRKPGRPPGSKNKPRMSFPRNAASIN